MAVKPQRPHFYKYTSVATAKIILQSGKVRYSHPSKLNDPFDSQFRLDLEFTVDDYCKAMVKRFLSFVNGDKPLSVETQSPFVVATELLRRSRKTLGLSDDELVREIMPAVEKGGRMLPRHMLEFQKTIDDHWLSDTKVFCVSEVPDQRLLWSHYAEEHRGVVLQLNCVEEIDNVLCMAKPIQYQAKPPALSTLDEWLDGLFTGKPFDGRIAWEKIFYTKQSDWSYEKEWRVAIPDVAKGEDYFYLSLRPQEVGGLIFGSKIAREDREQLENLMRERWPTANLFESRLDHSSFNIMIASIA